MGMFGLNLQSITDKLNELRGHLRDQNDAQAGHVLKLLGFERLMGSTPHNFGAERVQETGGHLRLCGLALTRKDLEGALAHAEHALERWARQEKG